MRHRVQLVRSYNYSYDARSGGPGRVQLWGSRGLVADVRFVDDAAAVPAPIPAADLRSATIFLKSSALPGLVALLRGNARVGVRIEEQGQVAIENTYGLGDSVVVCTACAPELLAAKTRGIREAMRRVIAFCGADARPEVCPATFHLNDDAYCGPYQSGVTTGYFSVDPSGLAHLCLYDVEKESRGLPFTVENAEKIQDQLLAVHECMHAWFTGRQQNYRVGEPFCKLVSFVVSEASGGPDFGSWFAHTADDHPDVLMKYLYQIGMNPERAGQTLRRLAQAADDKGSSLTDAEFAAVVTAVLGQDAVPAFRSAGILP